MFWIGLIVGIIIGIIGFAVFTMLYAPKLYNVSLDEAMDFMGVMYEAGHNRESTITLTHNGEVLDTVTFEEE